LPKDKKPFKKPALSLDQQVELLVSRGMNISDPTRAKHYLKFIGYYRLSGYFRFFTDPADEAREKFSKDTDFDAVLDLYVFDRKLRTLLMDAFERIEVAVKATLSHEACISRDVFWLCNSDNFDYGSHDAILEGIREAVGGPDSKPQHLFIYHFYNKYSDDLPPSWMIVETISFGLISKIYKCSRGEL